MVRSRAVEPIADDRADLAGGVEAGVVGTRRAGRAAVESGGGDGGSEVAVVAEEKVLPTPRTMT